MKADRMSADQALQDIADYVIDFKVESEEALNTARNCLIDTIGCGLLALKYPNSVLDPEALYKLCFMTTNQNLSIFSFHLLFSNGFIALKVK